MENIDLSLNGKDETKISIPSFSSFGLGFGEDKKWFFGFNLKSVSGNGYRNELMALDIVNFNEYIFNQSTNVFLETKLYNLLGEIQIFLVVFFFMFCFTFIILILFF